MLTENLKELTRLNELAQENAEKFIQTGNKAAGTRARIALQQIKNTAHEMRKQISESKVQTETAKANG